MGKPFYSIEELPTTSQQAIIRFDDRYLGSMGAVQPSSWNDLGDLIPSDSPLMRFPLSQFGLKYTRATGEGRTRTFGEKKFDIKSEEFKEGIQAPLQDILTKVFAYRNWADGPRRLMIAEANLRCDEIAKILESGDSDDWGGSDAIDGAKFFSKTHLSNVFDVGSAPWSNFDDAGLDVVSIANLQAQVTAMQEQVLDENGKRMGANPRVILVPTHKYEPLKNLLAKELIYDNGAATNNPYWSGQEESGDPNAAPNGRFKVVPVKQFTDTDDWYLIDPVLTADQNLPPWIALRWMVPTNSALALRYYGEDSDFFKDTGNIKANSHVWYGFSHGFPHGIRKIKGA